MEPNEHDRNDGFDVTTRKPMINSNKPLEQDSEENRVEREWGINRRTVLKSGAVASAVGLVGISATGTAIADESSTDCGPGCDPQCEAEVPLCAGQDIEVGTVYVRRVPGEDEIEVEYALDGETENDWYLRETHLYVGKTDPLELSSAPGQFPFSKEGYGEGVTEDTYTIGFDDICEYEVQRGSKWKKDGSCNVKEGDCVWVAAHAVVDEVLIEAPYFAADATYEAEQGVKKNGDPIDEDRSDSEDALVKAYPDGNFFSLGFMPDGEGGFKDEGGWIEVTLDCPVVNGEGDDLRLWEVTFADYPDERADVYAWYDGDWKLLGTADNTGQGNEDSPEAHTLSTFDLDNPADGEDAIEATKKIKIVDKTDPSLHDGNADAFDLDGIEVLQDCTEDETAWGDGCDGCEITDGGNWATYFQYGIGDCVEEKEVCVDVFEDFEAGDEIGGNNLNGITITSPDDGKIVALEEGEPPRFYGAPNETAADNGCMGDKVDIGFGDEDANEAGDPQNLDFAFDDPVLEFELRMLDYGDFNPTESEHHLVEITAYDGDDNTVDNETVEYWTDEEVNPDKAYDEKDDVLWEDLYTAGDACKAEDGEPGDHTFELAGEDIERVELRFGDGHDPKIAFDLPCITKEVVVLD